jgi:hypothetical protein
MRLSFRHIRIAAFLWMSFLCGCTNGVRPARMVVEADDINRDLNTLSGEFDATAPNNSSPRR